MTPLTMSRLRSRTGRATDPCQDHHWQDVSFSTKRKLPQQVSTSHEESPSCTTSLRLARGVSASHEDFLPHLWQLRSYEKTPSPTTCSHEEFPPLTKAGLTRGGQSVGTRADTNVVLPRRSGSPTTTHNTLVPHAMQMLQLAARASGRLWQGP
jgi:hypothetical protein